MTIITSERLNAFLGIIIFAFISVMTNRNVKYYHSDQNLIGSLPFNVGKKRDKIRKRSRFRSGFSRRSLIALLGACGTRVPGPRPSTGAPRLLLASPLDHFRLRQPRRQEVPSKDNSGRLNLQWSLRLFPDLFRQPAQNGRDPINH